MTRLEFRKFLELADRFRNTPVVDDDFPLMRDRFDFALRDAMLATKAPFPTTVCLCGSTRFGDAFRDAMRDETLAGKIVLSVGLLGHSEGIDMGGPVKAMLDQLHLRKIELADEVLILNVVARCCRECAKPLRLMTDDWWRCDECKSLRPIGEFVQLPYVGESTRRELAYARSLGKVVRFLNPEEPK